MTNKISHMTKIATRTTLKCYLMNENLKMHYITIKLKCTTKPNAHYLHFYIVAIYL